MTLRRIVSLGAAAVAVVATLSSAPVTAASNETLLSWSASTGDVSDVVLSRNGRLAVYLRQLDSRGEAIYVKDRTTGEVARITPWLDGSEGQDYWDISASGNGRVVFYSDSTNLYRHDRTSGTTFIVQSAKVPDPQLQRTGCRAVDETGRFVAVFTSKPLVAADANSLTDLYLFDATAKSFTLVSRNRDGAAVGAWNGTCPAMSKSASKVVFFSHANGIVAGDSDSRIDLFVWRRGDNSATLLSRGSRRPAPYCGASISPDGTRAVFAWKTSSVSRVDVAKTTTYSTPRQRVVLKNLMNDGCSWSWHDLAQSDDGRFLLYQEAASCGSKDFSRTIRLDTKTGNRLQVAGPCVKPFGKWISPTGSAAMVHERARPRVTLWRR